MRYGGPKIIAVSFLFSFLRLTLEGAEVHAATPITFSQLDVECRAPGVQLVTAFAGTAGALSRAGKVLVERADPFELAFLTLPDCKLVPVLSSRPRPMTVLSIAASGAAMFDGGVRDYQSQYIKLPNGDVQPLRPPTDGTKEWHPVLSDDGRAVVWIARRALGGGKLEEKLTIRDLASGAERAVPLNPGRMGFRLIGADVGAREYVLVSYPHTVLAVDDDGKTTWGPVEAQAIGGIIGPEFRRLGNDWFAWDHGGSDRSSIQWSTARGKGTRDFAPATLKSVDVEPDGTLIAYSTDANRALGAQGSIGILRVADGTDFFSHRGAADVAFVDARHLAVSTRAGVEVWRVPPSDTPPISDATAAPTERVDVEGRLTELGGNRGKAFGLNWEKPTAATATAILGRWKLVDLPQAPGCGGDRPFLEFRSDGTAYDLGPFKRKYSYRIDERAIVVGTPGSDGYLVYQMSGGFYLPSFECGLVKLQRMN